jgi:uncharacterized protein (DUF2062 family)
VPKRYFKKWLPSHDAILQNRWIQMFGDYLQHHNLWHLHRRSVSGGVAVGLFCGLIPGPLQMICAALLSVLFRVNLPIALVTTFYTNPLTIVPLYLLAYQLGDLVTGQSHTVSAAHLAVPEMGWDNWLSVSLQWIMSLGEPFVIGLPLLAALLAVLGYVVVRIGWRLHVVAQWRRRAAERKQRGC